MAETKHAAYSQTLTNILTTELNSLANNTNSSASSAVDNTTALDLLMDLELFVDTQGSARTSGGAVVVFMVRSLDGGTDYDDANETTARIVATFPLDAAVTARRASEVDIPVPPGLFKLFARNLTGQALAASGNTVAYRMHSIETA